MGVDLERSLQPPDVLLIHCNSKHPLPTTQEKTLESALDCKFKVVAEPQKIPGFLASRGK